MTLEEKIAKVKVLIKDDSVGDEEIELYLALAMDKILERVYPFKDTSEVISKKEIDPETGTEIDVEYPKYPMPVKYNNLQCELASRYIFRRGFEGQISSTDNGITRGFSSVNDEDLLGEVMQIVGVMG